MSHNWKTTILNTEAEVLCKLAELRGKRWLCRGQPNPYDNLVPSIDRKPRENFSRLKKLDLEQRSIDLFRSTARFFAHPGEEGAMADDFIALMVLRHYGVPTRLLDWSRSPYVAAYFAACCDDTECGEIWSFDEPRYEKEGKKQWKLWPETTTDGSGNDDKFEAGVTAFLADPLPDWFMCAFYDGFPRQYAQNGAYTATARFGRDQAEAIAYLLKKHSSHELFKFGAVLKPGLRKTLREEHGIWHGSLFPDTAGVAETARRLLFDDAQTTASSRCAPNEADAGTVRQ